MDLYSVLVTGANRGIGLEFVRQLSRLQKPPRFIFATYRSKASLEIEELAEDTGCLALQEIKKDSKECQVILIEMDATKLEDIVAARKVIQQTVGENGLTLLINNAGVLIRQQFPEITEENLLTHFTTNAIAPVRVFQEMLPLLQKAASRADTTSGMRVSRAAVLNMSSVCGCITNTDDSFPLTQVLISYKTSKAALNMAMRVISANVKKDGILVIMMCPGWVKTDMGTDEAQIMPEDSISAMLQTLSKLDDSHHGTYMDRLGNPFPF